MARAAIYTRLSKDRLEETSRERQEQDCRALCDLRGHTVEKVYTDLLSGYKRTVTRPGYEEFLRVIRAGTIDVAVIWKVDRLTRQGVREVGRLLTALEEGGVELISVQDSIDTSTAMGEGVLGLLASIAKQESENTSLRIRSAKAYHARNGRPNVGGNRPFGYNDDWLTVNEPEAALVRQAAERVLRGETLYSIVTGWAKAGVPTSTGGAWTTTTLRRVLTSARIRGERSHLGDVVGAADWPALVSPEVGEQLVASLRRPQRQPPVRSYALTGLLCCGRCDEKLIARRRDDGARSYQCVKEPDHPRSCGKLRVVADPLELLLRAAVFGVLDNAGILERLLAAPEEGNARDLIGARRRLTERLTVIEHDFYVAGTLQRARFDALRDELIEQMERVQKQIDAATASQVVSISKAEFAETWETGSVDQRRLLVGAVFPRVNVNPASRPSPRFELGRVQPVDREGGLWTFTPDDDDQPAAAWAPGGGTFPLHPYGWSLDRRRG